MIHEEEATGGGAALDANGMGTAGCDLLGELVFVEGCLLPVFLIGALAAVNSNKGPVIWESMELLKERHQRPLAVSWFIAAMTQRRTTSGMPEFLRRTPSGEH